MAGSIPGSDLAERAAARPAATVAPPRDRRWDMLRRAARARLAPFGAGVVLLAVLVALAAPLLAPYDPVAQNLGNTLARPGRANLLGTDNVGPGVVVALGVVYTPACARLMRGQVLTVNARDYVEAARALGAPGWRVAWRHVVPNAANPIIVQASLSVAFAILAEASLSFLGLGIQPPQASWGSMINAGRGYLQQAPWIVFGPGAALFVTVVGLNFVGDAIRDGLDPRLRE